MDSQHHQNASGYNPTWPTNLDAATHAARANVSQFITHFFQVSDNPDLTEEWLSFFGDEAKLVMGDKVAEGKEEIRTLRKGMWEKVKARKHTVRKVFPAVFPSGTVGGNDDGVLEFMLYGTVVYQFGENGGKEDKMDWAARAELIPQSSTRKDGEGSLEVEGNTTKYVFGRYRVYLAAGVE
ncbi:hypothetical protein B0T20DRAFT_107231 [Sordaria brevicollis]|uniref:Fungal specific transcription protein n=1 Tax=Sordaria brevicollis TaxID=83679 RepID=A0AAE0U245_SORBR|nr:hypothetical protein B0T20DRAFT_107231 [Sordaria brevicollis]